MAALCFTGGDILQAQKKEPFLAFGNPSFKHNFDLCLISAFLLAAAFFQNGVPALLQAAVCVSVCCLCEYFSFRFILGVQKPLSDLSAVKTGLLIALLLPASAPLYVGASASCFASLVCKLPFGSEKNAPFVPCAAAVCFASLCFPQYVFAYPAQAEQLSSVVFSDSESFVKGTSLLDMLNRGTFLRLNTFSVTALLSGSYPGAAGTTCVLVLIAAAVYLALRRTKTLTVSAGFLLACAVFAFLFPREHSGRLTCVVMELCAGSLLFVALLVANAPSTAPESTPRMLIYGAAAGIICMLLRSFFKNIDAPCLAVMIVNAASPVFLNREKGTKRKKEKRRVRA